MSSKIGAKRGHIISMIAKPMGLIIAPLAFALITVIVLLTALNETVGDVIGYGSVLFMKRESAYEAQNIFEPSSKESGTVNIEDIRFPKFKDVYGEIIIESAGIDCPLVFGDSEACLARGAGQYLFGIDCGSSQITNFR